MGANAVALLVQSFLDIALNGCQQAAALITSLFYFAVAKRDIKPSAKDADGLFPGFALGGGKNL